MDPYVFVEIHGIPVDCMERRTRTVTHSGHNPVFDESFEFQITLPELAMVRFVVLDDHFIGDEFIGGQGGLGGASWVSGWGLLSEWVGPPEMVSESPSW